MVAVVNQVMVNCDQCDQWLVKQGRSQCPMTNDRRVRRESVEAAWMLPSCVAECECPG